MTYGKFPETRMRRQRSHPWVRRMVAETELSTADLIQPLFVHEMAESLAIPSMPGIKRYSIAQIVLVATRCRDLGIPAIALFPVVPPELKDAEGSEALNPNNLICRTIKAIKKTLGNSIGVIADVALDPYTTHGHDGILSSPLEGEPELQRNSGGGKPKPDSAPPTGSLRSPTPPQGGSIDNDATVALLCKQAVVLAQAGADIVAPSDMMDGRIGAIREALDKSGEHNTQILSYAAKYASSFYGPFRDAVGSAGLLKGDKQTYQMDPRNTDEALREVALDIAEGADMVMVKPGMPYLDIIHRVSTEFKIHVFAYQVSGEYAMIRAGADAGYIDYHQAMMESLIALKRAGAVCIFTYAALEAAEYLRAGRVEECSFSG